MGLRNGQFWRLTFREFSLLLDRQQERTKREDRRAGEVVALLYNVNRSDKADPIDWRDVFPEWKEQTEETEDEMLRAMEMWAAATKHLPS